MIKHNKQQTGGTLLGLIIGLVVGLAIAVVVAVAITKSSLPFLNKMGRPDKAPELTAGQIADPNKPLYGNRGAVKEAAKDFVKEPEVHPTVEENKLPADKAPVAKSADVKPAVAKPDAADEKWISYLQAGAFREQADAENTKAKLALQGFEASISEKSSDNGPLYRVRLGPYNQLDAMNRVRGKLSDSGMDVAVVRIAK
jgi:cell division protein FtsN